MAQSRLCWKFEIDSELLATVSGSMKMMCVCGQSPYHHHHYHDHLYCHHCHRHIYQQHTFGRTYNPYNVAVNASCQWFYTTISLQHILLESTDLAVPRLLPWLLNFRTLAAVDPTCQYQWEWLSALVPLVVIKSCDSLLQPCRLRLYCDQMLGWRWREPHPWPGHGFLTEFVCIFFNFGLYYFCITELIDWLIDW